jgi:AcrR family transcriptional regulator
MSNTPRGQHANLSRELIVGEAIRLIERDGEAALSMRRLGSALGVQAMSLYHHVGSRDELTAAIAERIFEPARQLELEAGWREAAATFGRALRRVAVDHPQSFRLVGLGPLDAPRNLAEHLLEVLSGAGFSREDALALYRGIASLARGYALGETYGFTVGVGEIDADTAFERGLEALVRGFAPEGGR